MASPDDTPLPGRLTMLDPEIGRFKCEACGRTKYFRRSESAEYYKLGNWPRCCDRAMAINIAHGETGPEPGAEAASHKRT